MDVSSFLAAETNFFHKMVQHFNPLAGSFLETESPEPHDDVGTTFERNRSELIGRKNLSPKEKKVV